MKKLKMFVFLSGAVFVEESDSGRQQHRQQDPDALNRASGQQRNQRRQTENRDHRIKKLRQKYLQRRFPGRRREQIGPMFLPTDDNLGAAEATEFFNIPGFQSLFLPDFFRLPGDGD